jgi:outer membrane autotransporter protein
VVPGQFEVNGGFSDTNEEDSEGVLSLGAAAWFNEHHSIGFNYDTSEDVSAFDLGYRYTW